MEACGGVRSESCLQHGVQCKASCQFVNSNSFQHIHHYRLFLRCNVHKCSGGNANIHTCQSLIFLAVRETGKLWLFVTCSSIAMLYLQKPVEPLQTSRCRELGGAHGSRPDVSGFDIELLKSIPSYLQVLYALFCSG